MSDGLLNSSSDAACGGGAGAVDKPATEMQDSTPLVAAQAGPAGNGPADSGSAGCGPTAIESTPNEPADPQSSPEAPAGAQAALAAAQEAPAARRDGDENRERALESHSQPAQAEGSEGCAALEETATSESPAAPEAPAIHEAPAVSVASTVAAKSDAPHFTARQASAARKFGLVDADLAVLEALGAGGEALIERLVKADSELGRRFSRLGRAEQERQEKSTVETPVPRKEPVPQEKQEKEEVERLRVRVAELERGALAADAARQDLARQVRLRGEGFLGRPIQRRGGAELESPVDRTARALEEWQSRKGVQFFRQ
jgi:hypothetical protein